MMNTGLTINATANTIEMTKEFAKKLNTMEPKNILSFRKQEKIIQHTQLLHENL